MHYNYPPLAKVAALLDCETRLETRRGPQRVFVAGLGNFVPTCNFAVHHTGNSSPFMSVVVPPPRNQAPGIENVIPANDNSIPLSDNRISPSDNLSP